MTRPSGHLHTRPGWVDAGLLTPLGILTMLSRRARRITTSTLVAASVAGLLGIAPAALADRRAASAIGSPGPVRLGGQGRSAGPASRLALPAAWYLGQVPRWHGCLDRDDDPGLAAGYYRLQCATLTAPMDWNDPDNGQTVELAVSKLPASTAPAQGVLFTNPGGPGGAGIELPLLFVSDARTRLTRSQDIYGMDVRGTGNSSNVSCGGTPSGLLDPRDRTAANLDLIMDGAQLTARSCALAGGALLADVTTDQTVHDFDLLRRLAGAAKVNWLGYSAGTWLGAHYATAFPQNVGHMVLDSNVDFTGSWQAAFALQPMGFERRFRQDFLPWVAKYQALYHLGASADAVEASYERIRAGLQPDVPIDSAVTLDQLLAGSLYSKSLFPLAASVLADLDGFLAAQGRPAVTAADTAADARVMSRARDGVTAALPLLRRSVLAAQPFASDASSAAFLAVTCNDTPWIGDRAALVASSAASGAASPLIGWASVDQPCAFWPALGARTPAPTPTGAGVPPVLMVQSVHDPATPIEGARRAAAGFAGARLLTVIHEGDHGLYAGGNPCVDTAVETFILTGVLPAEGATCPGRPLPDPTLDVAAAGATAGAGRSASPTGSPLLPPPGTNPLLALRALTALTH